MSESARSAVHPVHPRAAFGHRDFRLYAGAELISNLAAMMMSVAVGWQVFALTHRPIDLGYVGLVQFVPSFGFALVAGHVADRFDRARLVALCSLMLAFAAAALFAVSASGFASLAHIFPILFVIGVARSFSAPAGQSLVPGLVPAAHFQNAVTWGSTVWQVSTIAGPSLGGLLYGFAKGPSFVYALAAVLFLSAAMLELSIRSRSVGTSNTTSAASGTDKPEKVTIKTVLAGVAYVRAHPVILGSISLDLFTVLLGGATALLPLYASDILHVGPWGLGILRSAPALGAAGMAIVLAYRPLKRRAGALLFVCVAIFGIGTIVFGLSRSVPLSLVALFVLGASDMVSVVIRSTVVQLRTPHAMRGRVSAVNMMFIVASNELGEFESGITAAWLGAVRAVVVGGIGTLLVVAVFALFFPALRKVDRLDAEDAS